VRWWTLIGQGPTLVAILATLAFARIPTLDVPGKLVPVRSAEGKLGQTTSGEQTSWRNTVSRMIAQHTTAKNRQAEHCRVVVVAH